MAIYTIARAAFIISLALAEPALASEAIAPPTGMKPCPAGDPVASVEARLATRVGGDFLGCFESGSIAAATRTAQRASMPVAYAFALALHDRTYSAADLRELLSKVEQQWVDFQPLDGRLPDAYVAAINGFVEEQGKVADATVQSVHPSLVKIDKTHDGYFTVTSIRTYIFAADGTRVTAIKVNANAVTVCNSKLIRLTIQRTLTDPADVARTEADIARWARSIAQT